MKYTAKQLVDLLATKHSQDLFVPECKNGPTQGTGHLRMDAWAMRHSWSQPNITGYEVKVSRSDFVGDNKWPLYLPYCNYFYFVTAPGVCDVKEVPENCGLMVASSTGSRLFTKRKAPYRDVTIPEDLWRYILICRTQIKHELSTSATKVAFWREWLAEKEEKREIGHECSKSLRDLHEREVDSVRRENHRLTKAMEGYDKIKLLLEKLEISPHQWMNESRLKEAIIEKYGATSPKAVRYAERIRDALEDLEKELGISEPETAD